MNRVIAEHMISSAVINHFARNGSSGTFGITMSPRPSVLNCTSTAVVQFASRKFGALHLIIGAVLVSTEATNLLNSFGITAH
ncbi:unnamed protein product [Gongylonema pulchrum]|uniref:Uncharacterized protein n=1 Tax=Gongylonema pulchrum TaxID=637853 RepID=A0A183F0J7_9BILA|nr:unnamed protein product [Gongylonema pulchrum]